MNHMKNQCKLYCPFDKALCPSCRWQTLAWARWVKVWWTVIWPDSTSPPPVVLTSTWRLRCGVDWTTLPRQTYSLWVWCSGLSWRESHLWKKGQRRNNWVCDQWRVSQSSHETSWWFLSFHDTVEKLKLIMVWGTLQSAIIWVLHYCAYKTATTCSMSQSSKGLPHVILAERLNVWSLDES